ncbi:MAG: leucine-rich repeat protein [Bacilli bacterium]|nr:leucine-rich repeat protein [Bacilli bacterium]
MQGKKGFTLIELLAVIIILGLVMVIVVPAVNNAIEKSQKKTSINSAQGLVRSVNIVQGEYIIDNPIKELIFTYTDGVETSNVPGLKLDYSGKKPKNGNIIVNENGEVAIAIHDGTYCVEKDFDDEEYEVIKKEKESCTLNVVVEYTDAACFVFDEEDKVIYGYNFSECPTDVVIPNQIDGVDVEHIDSHAFEWWEERGGPKLTSIVLPNKLLTIGSYAFCNNQITNVIIPSNVIEIDYGAFCGNPIANYEILGDPYIDADAFAPNCAW